MKSILLAEPDDVIRVLLRSALSSVAGWEVTAVTDGLHLLTMLDRTAPSLIVLDLVLPTLSGLAVYRLMRRCALTRSRPVLFVTGAGVLIHPANLDCLCSCIDAHADRTALISQAARLLGEAHPAT